MRAYQHSSYRSAAQHIRARSQTKQCTTVSVNEDVDTPVESGLPDWVLYAGGGLAVLLLALALTGDDDNNEGIQLL